MEETVQLRTYTVGDLKDWLIHNHPIEGLSSKVIAPIRAYAIAHNPFVRDEMKVVCALFVNDKVAAFTAAFPEILQKPEGQLAWWFSTLWCDPVYEGRGYGLIVVGTLAEEYGIENCFDAEGAPETVEILRMLGLKTDYFHRYVFSEKEIHQDSLRGRIAWLLDQIRRSFRYSLLKKCEHALEQCDYSLVYQKYMDDESYSFIQNHTRQDLVLRKLETFNWILQYPFFQTAPIKERSRLENQFSSMIDFYQSLLIKIFSGEQLVGISLVVLGPQSVSIKYLYYDKAYASLVFSSLLNHGLKTKAKRFETGDVSFVSFVKDYRVFSKCIDMMFSFSSSDTFPGIGGGTLQPGEGDMFV